MPLESKLPAVIAGTEVLAAKAVLKTAARIETGCKRRSRVDTGTMRGGWQTHVEDPLEVTVFNPVYYTIFNEYGTIYMSAQPMLRPSIEEARPEFEREMAEVYAL